MGGNNPFLNAYIVLTGYEWPLSTFNAAPFYHPPPNILSQFIATHALIFPQHVSSFILHFYFAHFSFIKKIMKRTRSHTCLHQRWRKQSVAPMAAFSFSSERRCALVYWTVCAVIVMHRGFLLRLLLMYHFLPLEPITQYCRIPRYIMLTWKVLSLMENCWVMLWIINIMTRLKSCLYCRLLCRVKGLSELPFPLLGHSHNIYSTSINHFANKKMWEMEAHSTLDSKIANITMRTSDKWPTKRIAICNKGGYIYSHETKNITQKN